MNENGIFNSNDPACGSLESSKVFNKYNGSYDRAIKVNGSLNFYNTWGDYKGDLAGCISDNSQCLRLSGGIFGYQDCGAVITLFDKVYRYMDDETNSAYYDHSASGVCRIIANKLKLNSDESISTVSCEYNFTPENGLQARKGNNTYLYDSIYSSGNNYIQYTNGLLIYWNFIVNHNQVITYPIPFISRPCVSFGYHSKGEEYTNIGYTVNDSNTGFTCKIRNLVNNTLATQSNVSCIAIGRWK